MTTSIIFLFAIAVSTTVIFLAIARVARAIHVLADAVYRLADKDRAPKATRSSDDDDSEESATEE